VSGEAFGAPGIPARWTHGNKDGVGTAYSSAAKVWFTLFSGIVTEVYYPTVDRPQIRDLQFLVTDGKSFFHEEKRDLKSETVRLPGHSLGFTATNRDPQGRYTLVKEIIVDPHLPCLLQHVRVSGPDPAFVGALQLYVLCAPHLGVGGAGNHGYVTTVGGRRILMACKDGVWLALAATVPFARMSCGFVGYSDGWTDLHDDFRMDFEYDRATDGNIALTGEVALGAARECTLAMAFGPSEHRAVATLMQSLSLPFAAHQSHYAEQWARVEAHGQTLDRQACDGGNLFRSSLSLLLAHEDKSYPGALIASLAIPWGEAKGDQDQGGYHLVWTRDLVNSATALLAAGDVATPLRALIFLAVSQHEDGGFAQNFWVTGQPYWSGIQLDEVAFPILLAWRLFAAKALADFDPAHLVKTGTAYLIRHGPVTQQERWEEASGYSPSTLASNIAALVCAAEPFRAWGDGATAAFAEDHADFLEAHLEDWTVTTTGTLVPGIPRHYVRILPEQAGDPRPGENLDGRQLEIKNLPDGQPHEFPAKNVVDGGCLELVRYGIRSATDPVILDTVKVLDAVLKVDTPAGPVWHRYNHDGYGQQDDGGPFTGVGCGRAWPLLTGERGHYELAAGRSPEPYLRTLEHLASTTGLLPEQVWDRPDRPQEFLDLGRPTGSAMPLMWAHAEYLKLLRSAADGRVYDLIEAVAQRYRDRPTPRRRVEMWRADWQPRSIPPGAILRVHGAEPFRLHWSADGWATVHDTESSANALEIHSADLPAAAAGARLRFTFYWPGRPGWEGRDYEVGVAGSVG